MIVLVNNYDSFVYNLYQLVGCMNPDIRVIRNDDMDAEAVLALDPSHIIVSPGPGHPRDAGMSIDLVKKAAGRVPLLGVCLGHQAICEAFGGVVGHAAHLMHGKASDIALDTSAALFRGLPERTVVGRYHSLAMDRATCPACLRITATSDDGEVMAVQHEAFSIHGLQFHPESILTPAGNWMLRNFLAETARH